MMSGLLVTLLMLLLAGCSPGHVAANKQGIAEYVWTGCHVVTDTPRKGSHAIHPLGDLKVGGKFFFNQVSLDGTVGPVTTGRPCSGSSGVE